jgi:pectate lyase
VNRSDPRLLFALLELHRASRNDAFLTQAEAIGQNILKQRAHNGWFVPSQRHVFCRVANDESQALLHLVAALMGKPEAVPTFTGAEPFFHPEYGNSTGRVYDSADIYGRTR